MVPTPGPKYRGEIDASETAKVNSTTPTPILLQQQPLLPPQQPPPVALLPSSLIEMITDIQARLDKIESQSASSFALMVAVQDLNEHVSNEQAATRLLVSESFKNLPPLTQCKSATPDPEIVSDTPDSETDDDQAPVVSTVVRSAPKRHRRKKNIQTSTTPATSNELGSSTDVEMPASSSKVQTFNIADSKDMKITEEQLKPFVGLDLKEFAEKAAILAGTKKPPKPLFLLEEEKEIAGRSLAELARKWKADNGQAIYPSDKQEIGVLTPQEQNMFRRTIQDIIRQRRLQSRLVYMQANGFPDSFICDTCSTVVGPGHLCQGTNWSQRLRGGPVPKSRQVVMTQDGQGAIRLAQRQFIDPKDLETTFKKVEEIKHVANLQQQIMQTDQVATANMIQVPPADVPPYPQSASSPSSSNFTSF